MSDFTIVKTDDALPYRDRILSFWGKYLPQTPPGRFEWLRSGNPAGPAVWFLALDRNTGELAGTTSLMPRNLTVRGAVIRAGIMGDFMVGERYRAFGPYLALLRETTGSRAGLGLDCLYTIPNPASRLACLRVGMEKVKDLHCFVRPLEVGLYLEKAAPRVVAAVLGSFVSAGLMLCSRELVVSTRSVREEEPRFDASFDEIWRRQRERSDALMGDRSAQYLTWRYGKNPLYRFRLLTHRENGSSPLGGYALLALVGKNKLEVYDICGTSDRVIERLIAAAVGIARRERCQAAYFRASPSSHVLRIFKRFRFLKTNDALELYYLGRPGIPLESWDFASGDRNI